jgi:hypothetical protein
MTWAAFIHEPAQVLIVQPGSGAWRLSYSAFIRSMRGWRRVYRAKRQGHLHSFDHIEYDPEARRAVPGIDCIGRRFLTIGPTLAAALIASDGGTADLHRDLDKIFAYRDDTDRAAPDVVRLVKRWGGSVSETG